MARKRSNDKQANASTYYGVEIVVASDYYATQIVVPDDAPRSGPSAPPPAQPQTGDNRVVRDDDI